MGKKRTPKVAPEVKEDQEESQKTDLPTLKLTPGQYWEWRQTISDQNLAESELKIAQAQLSMMEKDLEISRLKAMAFKNNLQGLVGKVELAKREYERFKKELQETVGIPFKKYTINENFEVNELID
jgi:hypothetical protein